MFYCNSIGIFVYVLGNCCSDISIVNFYIDIFLLVYYKIGLIEIEVGVNVGFLIGFIGSGGIIFFGIFQVGSLVEEFIVGVEYGYYSDEQGFDVVVQGSQFMFNIVLDFILFILINVYYEVVDNDENKFCIFDLGLNVGLLFFFNQGLYVGVCVNYGFIDVINEVQDISQVELVFGNCYIICDDKDQNIFIQVFVGFWFQDQEEGLEWELELELEME